MSLRLFRPCIWSSTCACMYVCIYVYIYIYIHTHTHICMHVHTHTHQVCVHTLAPLHKSRDMSGGYFLHVMHVCMHACMYVYTHLGTPAQIPRYEWRLLPPCMYVCMHVCMCLHTLAPLHKSRDMSGGCFLPMSMPFSIAGDRTGAPDAYMLAMLSESRSMYDCDTSSPVCMCIYVSVCTLFVCVARHPLLCVCVYVSACTFVFCVYVYAQSAKYKCLYVVLCCGRLFGDVILVCVCVYVRVCMYIYHSDVECVMYVYKHMMSTHTHTHTAYNKNLTDFNQALITAQGSQ
jgi:hypothetical protein